MKNFSNQICSFLICITFISACASVQKNKLKIEMISYDDFDGETLSPIWRTDRFEPGRVQFQNKIVQSGKGAIAIKLIKGDKFEPGDLESLPSERNELCETRELESEEGTTYEYQFSIYIPDDLPIVPVRLNIAQFKQRCALKKCDPENALIGVQYIDGKLSVKHQYGKHSEKLFSTQENLRNQWLNFIFRIKFSHQTDGRIEAWLQAKKIIDHTGYTAFINGVGYPEKNSYYFKMGLYRDQMDLPMQIYFDRYRKSRIMNSE